jgi:hypothetical protein
VERAVLDKLEKGCLADHCAIPSLLGLQQQSAKSDEAIRLQTVMSLHLGTFSDFELIGFSLQKPILWLQKVNMRRAGLESHNDHRHTVRSMKAGDRATQETSCPRSAMLLG